MRGDEAKGGVLDDFHIEKLSYEDDPEKKRDFLWRSRYLQIQEQRMFLIGVVLIYGASPMAQQNLPAMQDIAGSIPE